MNKIISLIVTYNPDIFLLRKQLYSLLDQVEFIIYVDNASENFSEIDVMINLFFKKIRLIANDANMGLGYAYNQGIDMAKNLDATHILFLDQDSILKNGFVDQLMNAFNTLSLSEVKVGAVGPIYINEATNEYYPITRYTGPFITRIHPTEEPVEASVLISSGSLISLSTLCEVGMMDEKLFIDYIDIEWSYRARKHGFKLFAIPKAIMTHQIGDRRMSVFGRKISVHSPIRRYYLTRNSIHMLRNKSVDWGYKMREAFFNFFRLIIFVTISNDRMNYLKLSLRGLLDGIKGIYGPYVNRKR